jgi:hypothetical protein
VKTANRQLTGTCPCGSASLFVVIDERNGTSEAVSAQLRLTASVVLPTPPLIAHGYYVRQAHQLLSLPRNHRDPDARPIALWQNTAQLRDRKLHTPVDLSPPAFF